MEGEKARCCLHLRVVTRGLPGDWQWLSPLPEPALPHRELLGMPVSHLFCDLRTQLGDLGLLPQTCAMLTCEPAEISQPRQAGI